MRWRPEGWTMNALANGNDPRARAIVMRVLYRVNRVIELLDHARAYPLEVRHALYVHLDSHLAFLHELDASARSARVFAPGGLDEFDPLTEQSVHEFLCYVPKCDFWRNPFHHAEAFVHIIGKALPQRCRNRSLEDAINSAIKEELAPNYTGPKYFVNGARHGLVTEYLRRILLVTLTGSYPHATCRPSFEARRAAYRLFEFEFDVNTLRTWLKQNRPTLFLAMTEFLVYAVPQIPALHTVVSAAYEWYEFSRVILTGCDQILRQAVEVAETLPDGRTVIHVSGPLDIGLPPSEELVRKFKKNRCRQLEHGFASCKYTLYDFMLTELLGVAERIDVDPREIVLTEPHVEALRELVRRTDAAGLIDWPLLAFFGVGDHALQILQLIQLCHTGHIPNRELQARLADLAPMPAYSWRLAQTFFRLVQTYHKLTLIELPHHWRAMHDHGLRARYSLEENAPIPEHVGRLLYCKSCQSIRSFVIDPKDPDSQLEYAFGVNAGLALLQSDGTIKYFCGRKKYRKSKKTINVTPDVEVPIDALEDVLQAEGALEPDDEDDESAAMVDASAYIHRPPTEAQLRDEMKMDLTQLRAQAPQPTVGRVARITPCATTELISIDLRGRLCQYGESLITICSCGVFTKLAPECFVGDTFKCHACRMVKVKQTLYCDFCTFVIPSGRYKVYELKGSEKYTCCSYHDRQKVLNSLDLTQCTKQDVIDAILREEKERKARVAKLPSNNRRTRTDKRR
jgi:hypothetical protein